MHQAEELLKPPPSTSILSGHRFAQINAEKDIMLGARNQLAIKLISNLFTLLLEPNTVRRFYNPENLRPMN